MSPSFFFADVIFPAFSAPYFAWFFFPVAAGLAMLAEVLVFRFATQQLTWLRAAAGTAGANLVSWFFGLLLSLVLPSGLVPHFMKQPDGSYAHTIEAGPMFGIYMIMGVSVAYLLSILIEVRVWRRFTRKNPIPNCLIVCIWANTASYLVLIGIAWIYVATNWW
jgi:hypothetical protein